MFGKRGSDSGTRETPAFRPPATPPAPQQALGQDRVQVDDRSRRHVGLVLRLENRHRDAETGERQCGGHAGRAGSDNDH